MKYLKNKLGGEMSNLGWESLAACGEHHKSQMISMTLYDRQQHGATARVFQTAVQVAAHPPLIPWAPSVVDITRGTH